MPRRGARPQPRPAPAAGPDTPATRGEVLVVGYGRFGSLLAGMLRSRYRVSVIDPRRSVRLPRGIRRVTPASIGAFRVVVLALPVSRMEGFLRSNGRRFSGGTFVADVSAVKEAPMRWMTRYLPPGVSFAGTHPLFGPDSSTGAGRALPVVVCRGTLSSACVRRLALAMRSLGMKPVEMEPATHDKIVGCSLLLTQWIGRSTAPHLPPSGGLPEPPSVGFLRTLARRACSDRHHILADIVLYNRFARGTLFRVSRSQARSASRLLERRRRKKD